eukprot:scaffold2686_cov176-Isochrysis_galbana.AAC.2
MLDLSEWSFALAHVALLAAEGEFVVERGKHWTLVYACVIVIDAPICGTHTHTAPPGPRAVWPIYSTHQVNRQVTPRLAAELTVG